MLPSHVKDYYPFKGLGAQEEVVQSVAGRDVRCTLYHLDPTLASVMRLGRLLSLTLPQAAKVVRELENSAASLSGFRMLATDHQELTIDEALRSWEHVSKQEFALLNTTVSIGVNIE
jgi:hypothetical protein